MFWFRSQLVAEFSYTLTEAKPEYPPTLECSYLALNAVAQSGMPGIRPHLNYSTSGIVSLVGHESVKAALAFSVRPSTGTWARKFGALKDRQRRSVERAPRDRTIFLLIQVDRPSADALERD